ncbi:MULTISPECIES: phenylacetate--CoA ligase family protein [unclassified Kitasatospora]|uniref:phenylacetate--CoA ligase family protein n=1 Tax=unclassified Kitasatospora TaxID=2633591 RepID=UPI0037FB08AD
MPALPLHALVDHARRHSPFYAELYRDVPAVVTSLAQLPLIDHVAFWSANRWPDNRLLTGPLTDAAVYKSGGTTGAPKFSPWTRSEHVDSVSAFGAGLVDAGLKPGQKVANLFRAGEFYSGFLFIEGALHHAPIDNVRLPVATAPDEYVADLIHSFGVDVLAGEPMKLSAVAETLLKQDRPAPQVELILFGGDILFNDLRPLLRSAFPNAALSSIGYASVDAGLVAGPVPAGDDLRVHRAFPNRTVVELVDDATGEPITEPGVPGRVVVTNLFRTLVPILRYPAGDRAEWTDTERGTFRLLGRSTEGARIGIVTMPTEDVRDVLLAHDPDHRITGLQFVQRRWEGRDGLVIRLGHTTDAPPSAAFTETLRQAVLDARPAYVSETAIGAIHPLRVEWVPRGELVTNPRTGKLRQVIDERPAH